MKNLFSILTMAACLLFLSSCEEDKAVVSGEITQVIVTTFPTTDANGEAWDFDLIGSENPDLELRFNRGGSISTSPLTADERYDDVESPGNYSFDEFGNNEWLLDVLTDDYTISLYDYDLIGSDEMASFTFSPTSYTSNAPSSFELTSGDATITVNVTWTFEE